MDDKKRVPNMNALLHKISEYMEEMPSGEGDKVDWEELAERKKTAQRALALLRDTLSNREKPPEPCDER